MSIPKSQLNKACSLPGGGIPIDAVGIEFYLVSLENRKVLGFQKMLVQVQDSLSQTEVQELVFLCSDMLKKDLSSVVTARELFSLLQNHDLLSSDDSSLLVELLNIIKHDKLIRDLQLNPQLSGSRVSPYRKLLFELSENISDDELKNIKFLLYKTLPRKKLQQDVTTLQLFLEMEKGGCMSADNLGTVETIIGNICPHLKKRISLYQMENGASVPEEVKCRDKSDSQKISILTRPVPPEDTVCTTYHQGVRSHEELLPPAYFNQPKPSCHETVSKSMEVQKLKRYDMNGDWRGFALIINNYDFSQCPHLNNREGTDIDEKSLAAVFKWLGFETVIKQDCNKDRMLSALDELRSRDHTQADCVVCCVLTHGFGGGLYGVDGGKVFLKELMERLNGHHCPSLKEKPKLFFIQACQGSQNQQVVFLQPDSSNNTSDMETGLFCDAQIPRQSIPAGADYLLAMATVPGYVSFRDKVRGTWFMQSLCQNLQQLVPSGIDLLSILTEVNNEVSQKADRTGTRKQMPQPEYTLTKRVVFPVPKTPMPSSSSFS
ncbi:caspase-8-like isoform X2 [Neoarius graeffei]|uniref:caspase-8-like isoform X2 n=1 Tax=Neoarius graeffei TaxID=443677 RepID=UPI00298BF002|nr:caspase-8-like isoform X2 [Neoarius graeffei]